MSIYANNQSIFHKRTGGIPKVAALINSTKFVDLKATGRTNEEIDAAIEASMQQHFPAWNR